MPDGRPPIRSHRTIPACRLASLGAAMLLLAGCALSSSSQMRFYPSSDAPARAPFTIELTRACELDDCRVQRIEARWPDGERLTGELRFLPVGVTPAEPFTGPVPGPALDEAPRRRPAVMALTGERGSRLRCDLVFTAGARRAVGVCKDAGGSVYSIEI